MSPSHTPLSLSPSLSATLWRLLRTDLGLSAVRELLAKPSVERLSAAQEEVNQIYALWCQERHTLRKELKQTASSQFRWAEEVRRAEQLLSAVLQLRDWLHLAAVVEDCVAAGRRSIDHAKLLAHTAQIRREQPALSEAEALGHALSVLQEAWATASFQALNHATDEQVHMLWSWIAPLNTPVTSPTLSAPPPWGDAPQWAPAPPPGLSLWARPSPGPVLVLVASAALLSITGHWALLAVGLALAGAGWGWAVQRHQQQRLQWAHGRLDRFADHLSAQLRYHLRVTTSAQLRAWAQQHALAPLGVARAAQHEQTLLLTEQQEALSSLSADSPVEEAWTSLQLREIDPISWTEDEATSARAV